MMSVEGMKVWRGILPNARIRIRGAVNAAGNQDVYRLKLKGRQSLELTLSHVAATNFDLLVSDGVTGTRLGACITDVAPETCTFTFPNARLIDVTIVPRTFTGTYTLEIVSTALERTQPDTIATEPSTVPLPTAAPSSPPTSSFALSVIKSGNGTGEVRVNPRGVLQCGEIPSSPGPNVSLEAGCAEIYDANTVVTLTAIPERTVDITTGSTFMGWGGGGCAGTEISCQVTMSADQTVVALFTTASPTPTAIPTPPDIAFQRTQFTPSVEMCLPSDCWEERSITTLPCGDATWSGEINATIANSGGASGPMNGEISI